MFGLLNSSQIYGFQQVHEHNANANQNPTTNIQPLITNSNNNNNNHNNHKHHRSTSNVSDTSKETNKFFATLSSMHGMKSPTNFIEKFLKTEILNGYDTIKNYKNFQHSSSSSSSSAAAGKQSVGHNSHPDGILTSFNCLQGSYRSNFDGEFYEVVNVNNSQKTTTTSKTTTKTASKKSPEMTIKCSKNLLSDTHTQQQQSPATLQNYQKIPESEHDLQMDVPLISSSGASSGEFNSDTTTTAQSATPSSASNLYKRFYFGTRSGNSKNIDVAQAQAQTNEIPSDNSSSSISTTTTNSSAATTTSLSVKSNDLQRSSSASSSSGDCAATRERKKQHIIDMLSSNNAHNKNSTSNSSSSGVQQPTALTPERAQRRKLMQMISNYDQQNKHLQRELAKEKRRRSEELACVVKSLLCFESKLKTDMKTVNQRLQEKDAEICRLVRLNRALRKELIKLQKVASEHINDEGVFEDGVEEAELERNSDKNLKADCLVLEALQCINCRKQFYDIDLKEGWTQTTAKDGARKIDDHTTEHGSSSDDTVSSSFYGARRSVRYTSKRTSGTFRDYMRSRSMNIEDPTLDNNSEGNTSTLSRDDSQTSYEKINIYSRTIERMHGVKCESERESEQSGVESTRPLSRISNKSNSSKIASAKDKQQQMEEDDGIFSPTQDDDFEEDNENDRALKIVARRSTEFSEASPKQVYETSTDDWYASASDPEEIGSGTSNLYGHGAVNPVLECVNQILLQQSMEDPSEVHNSLIGCTTNNENSNYKKQQQQLTPKCISALQMTTTNLPRRSSLSGRRSSRSNSHSSDGQPSRNGTLTRKRVHFSTKNSMVHVPRNDDDDNMVGSCGQQAANLISTLQQQQQQQQQHPQYYTMNFVTQTPAQQQSTAPNLRAVTIPTNSLNEITERERLEILNYESIYSNEYEPIGSELNSSNLYVDMESAAKLAVSVHSPHDVKVLKLPPALPPKPANLLKFKKSLQQLDEMPDEHLQQDCSASTVTDPDYCSISEVNMGMTSVQIVADVHKAPESEVADLETQSIGPPVSELDVEVSTVASDDTFAASEKTEEVEEIFADVPKLPNVAAIIAPKSAKYEHQMQQTYSDYMIMSPKMETPNMKLHNARQLLLSSSAMALNEFLTPKLDNTALKLQFNNANLQYKRKHVPNILQEINKRMSLPNSSATPNKVLFTPSKPIKPQTLLHSPLSPLSPVSPVSPLSTQPANTLLQNIEESSANLPIQPEYDWYNMDADYDDEPPLSQANLSKMNENGVNIMEEIQEDRESNATTTDDYNLNETIIEKPIVIMDELIDNSLNSSIESNGTSCTITNKNINNIKFNAKQIADANLNAAICEAINNFPLFNENSPHTPVAIPLNAMKTKKIRKNLANFEKFIEGSGLSTKPLPSKRKIYFAGPFV